MLCPGNTHAVPSLTSTTPYILVITHASHQISLAVQQTLLLLYVPLHRPCRMLLNITHARCPPTSALSCLSRPLLIHHYMNHFSVAALQINKVPGCRRPRTVPFCCNSSKSSSVAVSGPPKPDTGSSGDHSPSQHIGPMHESLLLCRSLLCPWVLFCILCRVPVVPSCPTSLCRLGTPAAASRGKPCLYWVPRGPILVSPLRPLVCPGPQHTAPAAL